METETTSPKSSSEILEDSTRAAQVKHRAVRGFISMSIREVLIGLAYVGANVALSHIFSEKLYGAFFFFQFTLTLYTSFTETGFAGTIIRQREMPDQTELSTVFYFQQGVVLAMVLILVAIAAPLSDALSLGDNDTWTIYGLALGFFISSLRTVPSALLERELHYQPLALVEVVQAIVFYGGTVALALLGWGIWSFAVALIARNCLAVIIVYALKPWLPSLRFNRTGLKAVLIFGLPYQLITIVSQLKDSLIPVLTLILFGSEQQAILGFALTQAEIPSRLAHVVGRITFPTFSRLQDNPSAVKTALEKSLSLLFLTAGVFTMAAAVLANPLIHYVYGDKWQSATTAFVLFSFTMLGGYITTPFFPLLSALGYVRAALIMALTWLGLAWVLGFVFSPIFGYNGIAVASATATLIVAFILGVLIYRRVKFSFWRSCRSSLIAFVPVAIGLWLAQGLITNFWLLVVVAGVGAVVYLGLVVLLEGRELKSTLQLMLRK